MKKIISIILMAAVIVTFNVNVGTAKTTTQQKSGSTENDGYLYEIYYEDGWNPVIQFVLISEDENHPVPDSIIAVSAPRSGYNNTIQANNDNGVRNTFEIDPKVYIENDAYTEGIMFINPETDKELYTIDFNAITDYIAPKVTWNNTVNQSGYYKQNSAVTIKGTAEDSKSGIKKIYIKDNEGIEKVLYTGVNGVETVNFEYEMYQASQYTLYVEDEAGNTTEQSTPLQFDITKPEIMVEEDCINDPTDFVFRFAATDPESGIRRIAMLDSITGSVLCEIIKEPAVEHVQNIARQTLAQNYTFPKDGTYHLTIVSENGLGEASTSQYIITKSKPVESKDPTPQTDESTKTINSITPEDLSKLLETYITNSLNKNINKLESETNETTKQSTAGKTEITTSEQSITPESIDENEETKLPYLSIKWKKVKRAQKYKIYIQQKKKYIRVGTTNKLKMQVSKISGTQIKAGKYKVRIIALNKKGKKLKVVQKKITAKE